MSFGTRVIIVLFLSSMKIIHGFSYMYSLDNGGNCSEFEGTRPHIWPLGDARALYESSTDPRSSSINNNTAGFTVNIYLSQQFNCSYHLPIEWVFHLDPETTSMNVEVDFSERIKMPAPGSGNGNESQNESNFNYTSNFRLLYLNQDLKNDMLFSCQPVALGDKCERNFLQVHKRVLGTEPTSTPSTSLNAISEALLGSPLNSTNVENQINQEECRVRLIVKIEKGNDVRYRWEAVSPSNAEIDETAYQTNETTYFENVFRLVDKSEEPSCVTMLTKNQPCAKCQYVGQVRNYTVNGVIFHASYNNQVSLYKGFFSVPNGLRAERKFYFSWQLSPKLIQDEMIQLQLPERIFANIPFTVVCRVSIFLFSYGTIITGKSESEMEEGRPTEYFKHDGYREVKLEMVFNVSNEAKYVSCFAPLKKSSEWIVKYSEVYIEEAIHPTIDGLNNSVEFRTISPGEVDVVVDCNVTSGNPTPTSEWILPAKLSTSDKDKLDFINEDNFSGIVFPKWEPNYYGTYLCHARNFLGISMKSVTFQEKDVGSASRLAIIISSTLGGCSVLLGGLIAFLAWRIRRQRLDFEIQTKKAIDEFKNGKDGGDKLSENDINFSVMQLPYDESFEVTREKWTIREKVLGSGQFGIVKMGEVVQKGETVKVAVKSLKSAVEIDEFKSFLFELKIMAYLGQHKNIVSVVAACTEGINDRDIFIGVEFCDNGCLLDHLRKFRASFQNMVTANGKLTADTSFNDNCSQYANITGISTYDLYRWAYHVACGMDYLRMRKVLHGDLAARNVLLNARKVAKVGDFGLSRVLMNSDNYTKRSQTALPWKWMAVESLKSRVFSVNSDVWAYGVFLYELFTVGQSPYPGVGWSPDFINQLENGLRMEKPIFCTNSIFKVMSSCWEHEPHLRPSYIKMKRKLAKGLHRLSIIQKNTQSANGQSPTKPKTQSFIGLIRASVPTPTAVNDTDTFSINMEDEEAYGNLPSRRTMNYYKND